MTVREELAAAAVQRRRVLGESERRIAEPGERFEFELELDLGKHDVAQLFNLNFGVRPDPELWRPEHVFLGNLDGHFQALNVDFLSEDRWIFTELKARGRRDKNAYGFVTILVKVALKRMLKKLEERLEEVTAKHEALSKKRYSLEEKLKKAQNQALLESNALQQIRWQARRRTEVKERFLLRLYALNESYTPKSVWDLIGPYHGARYFDTFTLYGNDGELTLVAKDNTALGTMTLAETLGLIIDYSLLENELKDAEEFVLLIKELLKP